MTAHAGVTLGRRPSACPSTRCPLPCPPSPRRHLPLPPGARRMVDLDSFSGLPRAPVTLGPVSVSRARRPRSLRRLGLMVPGAVSPPAHRGRAPCSAPAPAPAVLSGRLPTPAAALGEAPLRLLPAHSRATWVFRSPAPPAPPRPPSFLNTPHFWPF